MRFQSPLSGAVDAVFFDAVGTLLRLAEPVGATYTRLAARHAIRIDPSRAETRFRDTFGKIGRPCYGEADSPQAAERGWWRTLVRTVIEVPDDDAFDAFFAEVFAHFGTGAAWELFPDVRPALESLSRAGMRLAVLSNFDQRLRRVLADLEIDHYFEAVIISGELAMAKPDPRLFAAAVGELRLAVGHCLHVGDDPVDDWQGAAAAGLRVFQLQRPESGLDALLAAMEMSPL